MLMTPRGQHSVTQKAFPCCIMEELTMEERHRQNPHMDACFLLDSVGRCIRVAD